MFGLVPENIKQLALPNDLEVWPETALKGCSNLEFLFVYGSEVEEGNIEIRYAHELRDLKKLIFCQLPSTVTSIGNGLAGGGDTKVFPKNLRSIFFSKRIRTIGNETFMNTKLVFANFSECKKLGMIGVSAFLSGFNLWISPLDLSQNIFLRELGSGAFRHAQISVLILPPSMQKIGEVAFDCPKLMTVIWRGEKAQDIHPTAFGEGTFQELILHETA